MDIQMERLMKAHNKDFSGQRILELNPSHESDNRPKRQNQSG